MRAQFVSRQAPHASVSTLSAHAGGVRASACALVLASAPEARLRASIGADVACARRAEPGTSSQRAHALTALATSLRTAALWRHALGTQVMLTNGIVWRACEAGWGAGGRLRLRLGGRRGACWAGGITGARAVWHETALHIVYLSSKMRRGQHTRTRARARAHTHMHMRAHTHTHSLHPPRGPRRTSSARSRAATDNFRWAQNKNGRCAISRTQFRRISEVVRPRRETKRRAARRGAGRSGVGAGG